MNRLLCLLCLLWSVADASGSAEPDEILTVLHKADGPNDYHTWIHWSDPSMMLVDHLNELAFECLDKREAAIGELQDSEDWQARQRDVREYFDTHLGPWQPKTPLLPQITGRLQRDGYRVEKVVFESMPGFPVTGALFLPDGTSEPSPGILNVIGHSQESFRKEAYQNVILNLVHKGFVVLAIDPLGQGERVQYLDRESGESEVGRAIYEHSHAGVQCFLSGTSVARYFVWDAIRAVDYLASRPEVDPDRIGATGLSGGGTQSSYLGAIDQRVRAAAPMCFITNKRRLLQSIGPQDGEQNLYRSLLEGIDHADLLETRAPRPTLHVTTTRDFFPIQGARETEREVARAFAAFDAADNYQRVEDDHEHGFTRPNNEATYAFFQESLGLRGDSAERDYPYLTADELQVTPTGQVATSFDAKNVHDLLREFSNRLIAGMEASRNDAQTHLKTITHQAKQLSGYREPRQVPDAIFRGRYRRDGYVIEKWGVNGAGSTILPILLFLPEPDGDRLRSSQPAIIFADGRGKAAEAHPGGELEQLTMRGHVVASVDLLGFGETEYFRKNYHGPVQPFFNAQASGNSIVGINAADILRVKNFLMDRDLVQQDSVGVIARGATGPAALHAAAFDQAIAWLVLDETIVDYQSITMNRLYNVNANSLVAGALTAYDLPDLMAAILPRRLVIRNPVDHLGQPIREEVLKSVLPFPRRLAKHRGADRQFRIMQTDLGVHELID